MTSLSLSKLGTSLLISVCIPGVSSHEIVGHAVRVGTNVKGINIGDRVGVGAQIYSCGECRACKSDNENYCPKQVDTYVRFAWHSTSRESQ